MNTEKDILNPLPAQDALCPEITAIRLCSGIGQYHTNEINPTKPEKKLRPYLEISVAEILALVDKPQCVPKDQGQWFIPSAHMSRSFKTQEQEGVYASLWADLDKNPPPLEKIAELLAIACPGADYEVFNSRSATEDNQKARVLILLDTPFLLFPEWRIAQQILNDKLEAAGITPDRANERSAQLCYLPNRGAFYQSLSQRTGKLFNPGEVWSDEIAAKQEAIEDAEKEVMARKAEAMAKREAFTASGNLSIIDAFNQANVIEDILIQAGYDQYGDRFRHPNSESGSFSAGIEAGRVNALSPADPLYSDGKGAHDAFSAFEVLFHEGDRNAAMKDAGDNWLTINGEAWNAVKQREYMQDKEALDGLENLDEDESNTLNLLMYSLRGKSQDMFKQMQDDKFILGRIAVMGQITAFYAKPNAGKTLLTMRLLIDSIVADEINANNVFYINADDGFNALVYKNEIAEEHGFHMLAPGHRGFEHKNLVLIMDSMVKRDKAKGVIIILDTLKKFTDLMDKSSGSAFMKHARSFNAKGGSMILLGHANKNRNPQGGLVFSGTTDITDDCDCAYTLDEASRTGDIKRVIFENFKNRGNVAREAGYEYSIREGQNYKELLDSVRTLDKKAEVDAKADAAYNRQLEKDKLIIDAITETIQVGVTIKTEIIQKVFTDGAIPKPKIYIVLERYKGIEQCHLWAETIGYKNKKTYRLLGNRCQHP